jgi:toxin ParE1/3/4
MHRVEWKQIAEDELNAVIDFIADDSPNSAEDFAADLRAKTEKLREHPELYRPGRRRGTREMVVQPNYIVIYRVIKKFKVVEILRVKHVAKKWPATGERK